MPPTLAGIGHLQRIVGNQAVTALLATRIQRTPDTENTTALTVQRCGGTACCQACGGTSPRSHDDEDTDQALQRLASHGPGSQAAAGGIVQRSAPPHIPADCLQSRLAVTTRFVQRDKATADGNVKVEAVVDRLAHAITRKDISQGDQGSRYVINIDLEMAASALGHLTPNETGQVEVRWQQREKTNLRQVIGAKVPRHEPYNNLSEAGKLRLLALLGGTVADIDPGAPDLTQSTRSKTDKNALDADLMQLHDALLDKHTRDAVFAVLSRRGGPPGSPQRKALETGYHNIWKITLPTALTQSKGLAGPGMLIRAQALLEGNADRAAALAIEDVHRSNNWRSDHYERVQQALADVRAEVGGDPKRIQAILHQVGTYDQRTVATTLGISLDPTKKYSHNPAQRALETLARGSDAEVVAARLARLEAKKALQPRDVEVALLELRKSARLAVVRALTADPDGMYLFNDEQIAAIERETVMAVFREASQAHLAYTGQSLEMLARLTGSGIDQERNRELLRGLGSYQGDDNGTRDKPRSGDYIELDLAMAHGSHGDADYPRIKSLLEQRSAAELKVVADEYFQQTGGKTFYMFFDTAFWAVGAGQKRKTIEEIQNILKFGGAFAARPGDDLVTAGTAEGEFYWNKLEHLYSKVMNARGLFAGLRDWVGNESNELVELAYHRAEKAHQALAAAGATKSISQIQDQVAILKGSVSRLEHNLNIYTDDTKVAFHQFVDTAVFLVSTALTLGTAAPQIMFLRGLAGTVGTKIVLLQEDYSGRELLMDVLQQAGGALGAHVTTVTMQNLVLPRLARAAQLTGLKISPEIRALAGRGATMAAATVGSSYGSTGKGPSAQDFLGNLVPDVLNSGRAMMSKPRRADTKDRHVVEAHEGDVTVCQRCEGPSIRESVAKAPPDPQVKQGVRAAERAARRGDNQRASTLGAKAYDRALDVTEKDFRARSKKLMLTLPTIDRDILQARTKIPPGHDELTAVLDELAGRVTRIRDAGASPGNPAQAGDALVAAERTAAETRNLLARLPAVAAVRAQRRAWEKDPATAGSAALLHDIEGLLGRGTITAREGQRYLERIRQQTLTRPATTVGAPGVGLILPGDLNPPSDWPPRKTSYQEFRDHGKTLLQPGVTLQFPHGQVWVDNVTGETVAKGTLGASLGPEHRAKLGTQSDFRRDHPHQNPDFAVEIAHLLGPGTGFESQPGAADAPALINQRLQNWGIESSLRDFWTNAHSKDGKKALEWRQELSQRGLAAPELDIVARMAYSTTMPAFLGHVSYTVSASGSRGTHALFQAKISIDYARRVVHLTVEPLAHGGEYDWVRDELQSSRFTTRIVDQMKIFDTPGWTIVSGERKGS